MRNPTTDDYQRMSMPYNGAPSLGKTESAGTDSRGVTYVFTKDASLLLQYFKIREQSYSEYLGLKNFSGNLDDVDLRSEVLLAIKDGEVIGGVRVTLNDLVLETKLPMEEEGFMMEELFPEYDLEEYRYGEISRIVMKPEYRTGQYSYELSARIGKRCEKQRVRYMFSVATQKQARRNKLITKGLGYDCILRPDIAVPRKLIYGDVPMMLLVMIVTTVK